MDVYNLTLFRLAGLNIKVLIRLVRLTGHAPQSDQFGMESPVLTPKEPGSLKSPHCPSKEDTLSSRT